jgi:ATP-binding cassette subfamily F protein uup
MALQARLTRLVERMDASGAWSLEHEARTTLGRLGITDLGAQIGTLSGGQRKRVAMAAALIGPTDLLILDEPTNHIDIDTVAWLEAFLARSAGALLLVTHDRYFLDRVVDRVFELRDGELRVYEGGYSYYADERARRERPPVIQPPRHQDTKGKPVAQPKAQSAKPKPPR